MSRDIWVWLELSPEGVKAISTEAVHLARSLASSLNAGVTGIVYSAGNEPFNQSLVEGLDVDQVLTVSSQGEMPATPLDHLEFLGNQVQDNKPYLILLGATNQGKELAAALSARLDAPLAPDCTQVEADANNQIKISRPVYAGKALSSQILTGEGPYILTLRANVFRSQENQEGKAGPAVEAAGELTVGQLGLKIAEIIRKDGANQDITEARIIVSGGLGMQGPENFKLLEDLAAAVGGAVGASRPVVDNGWREYSNQVGQTGRTVSPDLYIACGISGAVQHLAGMSSSRCIVAINSDANAPIFEVCDYGIVGNALEVVPALTRAIQSILK